MPAPVENASARPPANGIDTLLAGLNPEQRAAAEAVRGAVCILAGAGTGKTRTITHRIAAQIVSGIARPDQILAVTFTDRAAGELRARLAVLGAAGNDAAGAAGDAAGAAGDAAGDAAAPQPRPEAVRAATFHAAAWAQLRYFWPRVSEQPPPEVLGSKVPLLGRAALRLRVEAKDLAAEIEWAKARGLSPDQYWTAAAGRDLPVPADVLAEVFADYERAKDAANAVDYEDMILRTAELLERDAEAAAQVRDRYRFFTVDEFQDVNPAQWRLLRAWLGERDELCVVGDDDQSIYGFTGATPEYLLTFARLVPGARVFRLSRNYRSTPQVLELANRVLGRRSVGRRLVAAGLPGPAPTLREFRTAEGEVDGVIADVRRLIDHGVRPGEIAICYRVNRQSEPFEAALGEAGIPFVVRGEGGFFTRPEIQQAVRALRQEAQRQAGAAAAGAAAAGAAAGAGGTAQAGAAAGRTGGSAGAFANARPARPPRLDREVERVLRETLSFHPKREPEGEAARERWRNLAALLELAQARTQASPALGLGGFVAELDERTAAGHDTAGPDGAVTLVTLHKAKGLEFDAVYLVGVEEGLLPIGHARDDAAVAEERRLLYVGVTRARVHLWLSWTLSRPSAGGGNSRRRPSRFLHSLRRG